MARSYGRMVRSYGTVTDALSEEKDAFFGAESACVPGETAWLRHSEATRFAGVSPGKFFPNFFWTSATDRRSLLLMVMKLMSFAETDPVLAAIHAAPVVEASAEEMAAFEEGMAEIHAGRAISATQIRQHIELLGNP